MNVNDNFHRIVFQFHKGTIKPHHKTDCVYLFRQFQFHKGTIKPLQNGGDLDGSDISIP